MPNSLDGGKTALHHASSNCIRSSNNSVIKLLLMYDADKSLVNDEGYTPLKYFELLRINQSSLSMESEERILEVYDEAIYLLTPSCSPCLEVNDMDL